MKIRIVPHSYRFVPPPAAQDVASPGAKGLFIGMLYDPARFGPGVRLRSGAGFLFGMEGGRWDE